MPSTAVAPVDGFRSVSRYNSAPIDAGSNVPGANVTVIVRDPFTTSAVALTRSGATGRRGSKVASPTASNTSPWSFTGAVDGELGAPQPSAESANIATSVSRVNACAISRLLRAAA